MIDSVDEFDGDNGVASPAVSYALMPDCAVKETREEKEDNAFIDDV